jgi:hypothetical protein
MKRTILLTITLVSFFMVSCGSTFESEVAEMAEIQCQAIKIQKKAMAGDEAAKEAAKEELKKLGDKMIAKGKELSEKYPGEEDKKKFQEAMEKAIKAKGCED